jgi:AraC family transcriptional activator of pobA
MQVGEVSWALGFADAAYFTRFFAQKTGLAPSRFRAAFA